MTRNCSWTLLSVLFLVLGATSPTQACEPPELTWARGAGGGGFDSARDVARAGDGWVVCGGYNGVATFGGTQLVSTGASEGYVACYGGDGSVRWAWTTSGAPGHSAHVFDVAANDAGQVFAAGAFIGSVTFGGVTLESQGVHDSFVAAFDSTGALLWARHVAGPGDEVANSICALGTGAIAVVGRFDQLATLYGTTSTWTVASVGQSDAFYAVFTTSGALNFARSEGGAGAEGADEVVASPDGSTFAFTGAMLGATTFGLGHGTTTTFSSTVWSQYVASYTPEGTLRWVKRASHAGATGGSSGNGIAALADGSFVATGQLSGSATFGAGEANATTLTIPAGIANGFLARYGPDGQLAWARRVGSASFTTVASVCVVAGGHLLVAGGFEGSPVFGEGLPDETTLASAGGRDGFVARFSAAGDFLWVQHAGGTQFDEAYGVAATDAGDAVFVGTFYGSVLFDSEGQQSTTALTSAGWSDVYIGHYAATSSGFEWARAAGGTGYGWGTGVAGHADGSTVVTGNFEGTMVFGSGEAQEATLTSPYRAAFVARYAAKGGLLWVRGTAGTGWWWVESTSAVGHADGSTAVTGNLFGDVIFGAGEANETRVNSGYSGRSFVARYAADGSVLWVRTATGTGVAVGAGAAGHIDGSTVMTGWFHGDVIFGAGEEGETRLNSGDNDASFVARYAADGRLLWARAATGSRVEGQGAAGLADGSTVVSGLFEGTVVLGAGEAGETLLNSGNNQKSFVARYAADGRLLWARGLTGSGFVGKPGSFNGSWGVIGHADGSSVVAGTLAGTVVFGAGEEHETILERSNWSAFVARYSGDGKLLWARATTSTETVDGSGVAGHADGSTVVTGRFWGNAVFGAGEPCETILDTGYGWSAFVARYAGDGALLWARAVTVGGNAVGFAIAAHADGASVVTGVFSETATFGVGEARETTLNADPYLKPFVARYSDVLVWGPESITAGCTGDGATEVVFDLHVAGCADIAILTVTDVTQGRTLYSGSASEGTLTVGPHVFPDGLSVVQAEIVAARRRVAFHSLTVQVGDTTPPVLEGCLPATLELQGPLTTLYKSMLGISAADACDPAPTVTFSPAAVPLGTTDVLVTAEDASGNTTTCTIQVTIVDTTAPVFDVAPGDIDRECFGGSVIVNFDILASDLSGTATISCTDETGRTVDPAGTTFEDGVHAVTCVASDSSGNVVTHTFTITVSDNTAPVLVTPDDITVANEPGEAFAFVTFSVSATDNCDPSVPIVCTTPSGEVRSGDAFPVGVTVVTCTATDLAGNEATATFQILVRDAEPPVLTCPAAVELHTDTVGTPLAVTPQDLGVQVTDNWDPAPTVLCEPGIVAVGTTAVTVTARDADGNESTCSVDVTVLLTGQETTQAGSDVVVAPETKLPDGSTATVTIEFSQVGTGGVTTVTTSDNGQPLPNGFKLGNPPIYYDVSTTAQFSGTVELCFTWEEGQIANENNARLFHYENGTWVDVTTSVDTVNNIVCGAVTSLSPFAIVEPSYTFGGILQPIAADGSSIFKRGRVLPVKFELFNPDGSHAADATVRLKLVKISSNVLGTVEEEIDPATVGSANTGNVFRYDADSHQFIYNLATSGLTAGTYRLEILPDDGSRHTARISIRD